MLPYSSVVLVVAVCLCVWDQMLDLVFFYDFVRGECCVVYS